MKLYQKSVYLCCEYVNTSVLLSVLHVDGNKMMKQM